MSADEAATECQQARVAGFRTTECDRSGRESDRYVGHGYADVEVGVAVVCGRTEVECAVVEGDDAPGL